MDSCPKSILYQNGQILEATVQGYNFCFDLFLEFGHVTTLPMTYGLDPDRYNHHYLLFLHILVRNP